MCFAWKDVEKTIFKLRKHSRREKRLVRKSSAIWYPKAQKRFFSFPFLSFHPFLITFVNGKKPGRDEKRYNIKFNSTSSGEIRRETNCQIDVLLYRFARSTDCQADLCKNKLSLRCIRRRMR